MYLYTHSTNREKTVYTRHVMCYYYIGNGVIIMGEFSTSLRQLRVEHKMTQAELAQRIGVSRSSVGMYESGEREPDFETLEAIADIFNVDMNRLHGKEKPAINEDDRLSEDKKLIIQIVENLTDRQAKLARNYMELLIDEDKK